MNAELREANNKMAELLFSPPTRSQVEIENAGARGLISGILIDMQAQHSKLGWDINRLEQYLSAADKRIAELEGK